MDFATRDRYRHAIEDLARGSGRTELDVTRAALAWAQRAGAGVGRDSRGPVRGSRILPHLEGPGGLRGGPRLPGAARAGGCFAPTSPPRHRAIWAASRSSRRFSSPSRSTPRWPPACTPIPRRCWGWSPFSPRPISPSRSSIAPSWSCSARGCCRASSSVTGCRPSLRTLVVVPTLLTSEADIDEQIGRLEIHHLANADGDIRLALLSDHAGRAGGNDARRCDGWSRPPPRASRV